MTTRQHEHRCATCSTRWLDGDAEASCPNVECCGDRVEERQPIGKFRCPGDGCGIRFASKYSTRSDGNHGVKCTACGATAAMELMYADDTHPASCMCNTCCADAIDYAIHGDAQAIDAADVSEQQAAEEDARREADRVRNQARRDAIDPPHYTSHNSGVECIAITEHFNFCLGNAIKYIWRAGRKGGFDKMVEDLKKARWYLDREIQRLEGDR